MKTATLPRAGAVNPGRGTAVISAAGLRKRYGNIEAVQGIDLTVFEGEIFAFLGPNGAGKTTTVEMLEGYRPRTAGQVQVLGQDPAHPTREWRSRIGLVLQTCHLPADLTVRELVSRYAAYYPHPRGIDETIDHVGLGTKQKARAGSLSGGQQRRLDVALALIGDPDLIFLDEPTTGFDPAARHQAWDMIGNLRDLGKTVFLTTHFMDEAEALADRLAVIANGHIIAEGTPETLGHWDESSEIEFSLPGDGAGALPASIREQLTAALTTTASLFPVRHFNTAMWTVFNPHTTGMGFQWMDIGVIALWGLAGLLIAVRFFR
jgi:ABC-2 type transport system ATP-binding protein